MKINKTYIELDDYTEKKKTFQPQSKLLIF